MLIVHLKKGLKDRILFNRMSFVDDSLIARHLWMAPMSFMVTPRPQPTSRYPVFENYMVVIYKEPKTPNFSSQVLIAQ